MFLDKMRQIMPLMVCVLTAALAGCNSPKVSTTLALDISESSVANTTNQKLLEDICKVITLNLRSPDELIIKRFDSSPNPALLDTSITRSNAQQWQEYGEKNCPSIFPGNASPKALPGTDIRQPWLSFYKGYTERKSLYAKVHGDRADSSKASVEFFIALVDSLEPVSQSESEKPKLKEFQTSIQKFIDDGNFIFIFISNEADRQRLAKDLEPISNASRRLIFLDRDYKPKIDFAYSQARSKN
jgi:hypothetical protein